MKSNKNTILTNGLNNKKQKTKTKKKQVNTTKVATVYGNKKNRCVAILIQNLESSSLSRNRHYFENVYRRISLSNKLSSE